MLRLVENNQDKASTQSRFAKSLQAEWKAREDRMIVWRGGSRRREIAHNGRIWFTPVRLHKGQKTPRFWNAFGLYHPRSTQNLLITVEVNIPLQTNSKRVAGFFARDDETGMLYVLHDGSIGGGRPGIGREAFLQWSGAQPVAVQTSTGFRHGIIVTALGRRRVGPNLERFVQTVAAFKIAASSGDTGQLPARGAKTYSDYFREFSGTKRGKRIAEFEYASRHGEVVHALQEWRKNHNLADSTHERIVKDANIDLGVEDKSGQLVELYEVKTNADRQTLYTAIGQLIVHGGFSMRKTTQLILVIPHSASIPSDVDRAIRQLGIRVLRFEINDAVNIL